MFEDLYHFQRNGLWNEIYFHTHCKNNEDNTLLPLYHKTMVHLLTRSAFQ